MESCLCQIAGCILCGAQLHSEIAPEQVCQIRGMLSKHSYAPRELLFRDGDPGTHLILIREGLIKLTALGADGQEQIIGFGEPGHIIGFGTVYDETYTFTAETITPVVACKIQRMDMLRILEQNPNVLLRVVRMLNDELARANGLIQVLGQKSPVERVATFILSLVPQKQDTSKKLLLPLSREEMAKTVGLRVETVSRVMADLQRRGVIEAPRGHIRILDYKWLRSLGVISTSASQAAGNLSLLSHQGMNLPQHRRPGTPMPAFLLYVAYPWRKIPSSNSNAAVARSNEISFNNQKDRNKPIILVSRVSSNSKRQAS